MTDYEMMVAMLEKTVASQNFNLDTMNDGTKFIDIAPQGTKDCVSFMFDKDGKFIGFERLD